MTENEEEDIHILPYSWIVGQKQLKLALDLAYVVPRIGGVLISGERGTGKSTIVRAFSRMMYNGTLPVTIPINATEDRVVGGWEIEELMAGRPKPKEGLLAAAHHKLLYVDEVNLLDDHIVNIILDVTSTGVLVIEREGQDEKKQVQFMFVGTMNPEEGSLRPQLLDRFGLMVSIRAEADIAIRRQILRTVLKFDEELSRLKAGQESLLLSLAVQEEQEYKERLRKAHKDSSEIRVPDEIYEKCVILAREFQVEGHRSDYLLALAARGCAALQGKKQVDLEDVREVAPLVLQHRRSKATSLNAALWTEEEETLLEKLLTDVHV